MATRKRLFDPAPEEAIVLALFDLTTRLSRLGEALAVQVGITTQQYLVLLQVAGDPNFHVQPGRDVLPSSGVLASDIATARGVSRANVSALLAGLLKRGFVRQEALPSDRRHKRLFLTDAGRAALQQLEAGRRAANRQLLADLGATERRALLEALGGCLKQTWDIEQQGGLNGGNGASAPRRPRPARRSSGTPR